MAQHAAKGARFQAVTANRLSDGEVVYFSADNRSEAVQANQQAIAQGCLYVCAFLGLVACWYAVYAWLGGTLTPEVHGAVHEALRHCEQ